MKMEELSALLEKYQKGLCTEEEQKAIDEWYASLSIGEDMPLSNAEIEASLAGIRGNLPGAGQPDRSETGRPVGSIDAHRFIKINLRHLRIAIAAAAALILFGGSVAWIYWFAPGKNPNLALLNGADTIIVTGRGETRQVILPDGSTIQLNAGTVFSYPKHFPGRTRPVSLSKGEAFFQVVSDPSRPFTVTTGKLQTTVLGTSFDIRSYEQEKEVRIALLTGKINITEKDGNPPVLLQPHQLLRLNRYTDTPQTDSFENKDDVAAWAEGALYLKDASFEDIAFEIGNKYNVGLINKSDKLRWSYTGLFRNESLQEVIETICQTEHLSYTFRDNEILITNK
jgi:transmembrane sensor